MFLVSNVSVLAGSLVTSGVEETEGGEAVRGVTVDLGRAVVVEEEDDDDDDVVAFDEGFEGGALVF